MKVAIIEPVGGHGGMDYYDYGLSYGLGGNDVEVFYYTCDETHIRDFKNVHTIFSFVNLWDGSFVNKAYKYLKGHFYSYRDVRKKGVKIIHLHFFTFRTIDYFVLLMAKCFKLTIVVTVHDVNAFDKKANSKIEKQSYKFIDGVVVHNQSSFEDLKKKSFIIKKMTIIAHGNYEPFIKKIASKISHEKVFTLLFFGQIKKVKGLDILLKSISIIKEKGYNIKLLIAGKAWKSDLDNYTQLINDLGIENEVETNFRYIPDEEVSSFYEKADLVVLPYTEIYQSGVVLLTMSYGRPVLCSNLNAFKEVVIAKNTGFIFENKNENDLASKIIEIMKLPSTVLDKIVENASTLMKSKYDWVKIGQQTKQFYNSLI